MSNDFIAELDTLPALTNPTIFDPSSGDEIRAHLAEHGYVLVKAMEPEEARAICSGFWDWLEDLGVGVKRDDPSTWDPNGPWPRQEKGIIGHFGIGQAAFMWKCRTTPGVLRGFREVWKAERDEDLITSFDGAGMYPVGKDPLGENQDDNRETTIPSHFAAKGSYKLWPHRDQASDEGSMICVQGVLNLTSNEGKHDGGLVMWPGSHLIDWVKKYPKVSHSSFFMVPRDIPDITPSNSVTLRAPAGTLMLWDSRTIHCNRPPTPQGRTRAVAYVCMFKRDRATPAILKKRCKYYETWRTTTHWPTPVTANQEAEIVNKKGERPYGEKDKLVRSLVGYSDEGRSRTTNVLQGFANVFNAS